MTSFAPHDPSAYDYELPAGSVAARPVSPRDAARLLVLKREGEARLDRQVRDLPDLLHQGDLLVVNETRVLPARLFGSIEGGTRELEILLIREVSLRRWEAWVRSARRLRPNDKVSFKGQDAVAHFLGRDGERVLFDFEGDVAGLLGAAGHIPLPPYIRRPDDVADREDYQTLFARVPGAVAAPTAGLHFTQNLLARLNDRRIPHTRILLHVGPGTFRPIRATDLREHRVDAEYYSVGQDAARAIMEARKRGGRIVAVGTTTVRALESWVRAACPAADPKAFPATGPHEGWTDLTITPPFEFRIVDVLMTNFHLPRSSLLLLVCAFAGRELTLAAYAEAIRLGYRFYSYGDAMLIL